MSTKQSQCHRAAARSSGAAFPSLSVVAGPTLRHRGPARRVLDSARRRVAKRQHRAVFGQRSGLSLLFLREFSKITCFRPWHDGDLVYANHGFFHVGRDCPPCRILGPPGPRRSLPVLGMAVELVAALWAAGTWGTRYSGRHRAQVVVVVGLASTRLMVLGVLDTSGRLAGIAPWYLQRSTAKGWVLRWLGSGEVCSDYASILCMPEDADRVTEAIAAYLTGSNCASGARSLLGPLGNRRCGCGRPQRHTALAAA